MFKLNEVRIQKNILLVCDVDGTLINSNAGFSLAVQEVLKNKFKIQIDSNEITPLGGLPLREIIEKFTGPINTGIYHSAAKLYRDTYNSKYIHQIDLFPGVMETLKKLADYCYLSTATNLPGKQTRLLFEKLELSPFFDKIRGTDMDDLPKPNPALILEAVEEFGVSLERTFMVGDSFNDVKAGKNAGVNTIAACYQGKNSYIEELKPDHTINRFNQLHEIIER